MTTAANSRSLDVAKSILQPLSLTSAISRPTRLPAGPAPGCRPSPSGRISPHPPILTLAISWTKPGRSPRDPAAPCLATFGNGRRALSPRTRASPPLPARWASTTANSCAGSSCSKAPAARRRAVTAAPPTATSSRPPRAGSSRGCALLKTLDPQILSFREDVLAGLSAPIPAVPARWLYDRRGSELFDEITRLPSYYPTRTETKLLQDILPKLAAMVPKGAAVVEFGAGSATKAPLLLEAIAPAAYVPVDISGDYLEHSAAELQQRFPKLDVIPVTADFGRPFSLPGGIENLPRLGFFPGSTIGNFVPGSACDLLRQFRSLLGAGSQLLIGMDRVKPVE